MFLVFQYASWMLIWKLYISSLIIIIIIFFWEELIEFCDRATWKKENLSFMSAL